MKTIRTLTDNSILTVVIENNEYSAKVSTDIRNLGFEGDYGKVKKGETSDSIADEIEMWMEDNLMK